MLPASFSGSHKGGYVTENSVRRDYRAKPALRRPFTNDSKLIIVTLKIIRRPRHCGTFPMISARTSQRRITFITAGQSPRADVVAETRAHVGEECDLVEIGVLDGLSKSAIADLSPRRDERSIITRLADGSSVVVSEAWISRKVTHICAQYGRGPNDLAVVGSTGLFGVGRRSPYVIQAQMALEQTIEVLFMAGQSVGHILPLASQVKVRPSFTDVPYVGAHASPGDRGALLQACDRLAECDFIVLNSIGYTEADRIVVARMSSKPVLLTRRIVAGMLTKALRRCGYANLNQAIDPESDLGVLIAGLTPREYQVFELVIEGRSNKEIARFLEISPRTVEIHRGHMMEKMGVSSTAGLIWMVVSADAGTSRPS